MSPDDRRDLGDRGAGHEHGKRLSSGADGCCADQRRKRLLAK
jgi:hypothetical protein